ncbi:MAG TPA: glycosyltransferase family 4 protein [Pirellulales bacterium]|nr:glycosyltransferase family 4 protein [Pirellulales bacterium]
MRIVVAHNYYKQSGGEDRVFADEVELLEAHGHWVEQFNAHNDTIKARPGFKVAWGTIWNRRAAGEMGRLFEGQRPHVAHFHNTFPLISPGAYYAARAAGAVVVQTLHNFRLVCPQAALFRDGAPCESCLGRTIPWPAVAHACYRESRAASAVVAAMLVAHRALGTWLRTVNVYIALTQFARDKFIAGGLPADRIVVKPNFVHPDPGAGCGEGGYVLFVGRLAPEKGVSTLVSAWRGQASRIPLVVVGDGPLAGEIRALAATNPAVEWLGWRSPAEVEQLMGRASLLLLPSSWYEGLPKTAIESFAKGTPVVASRIGGLAEIVDDAHNGALFEAGNSEDLAAKVCSLVESPEQLARLRRGARAEFEAKYTAARNYEMLVDIYRKALEASAEPGELGLKWDCPSEAAVVAPPASGTGT